MINKKTNIIIVCIYRHLAMNLNEFNDNYLNVFLLGDFNVNMINTPEQIYFLTHLCFAIHILSNYRD